MRFDDKTRRVVFAVALCIIVLCTVWMLVRGTTSERNKVCGMLNEYGYSFYEDDLLIAFDSADTTIKEVLADNTEADMEKAVSVSKQAGFRSDVEKRGGVTLMLAHDGTDVITLYLVDGEAELCFIETQDNEIKPLGEGKNG